MPSWYEISGLALVVGLVLAWLGAALHRQPFWVWVVSSICAFGVLGLGWILKRREMHS